MWYLGSSLWFILVSHQPTQLGLTIATGYKRVPISKRGLALIVDMCEEEDFVWVTWVGNKNSPYNNKTHKIPKKTLVDPPTKLEVGTPVQVYWDKDTFRKFWSAVIAEPKTKRKRKRDVETNDGKFFLDYFRYIYLKSYIDHNSSAPQKNKKGKKPAPCKFIDDGKLH